MRQLLIRRLFAIGIVVAGLAGCAAPPKTETSLGPAFYPLPPDPPRIQHLVTLRGEKDLAAEQSALAKFVAGDDPNALSLRQPYGAAFADGKLYVVDTKGPGARGPGLAIFDFATRKFTTTPGTGGGRMRRPINITIDADGTRYVTDTERDEVLVYDRNDRFVRTLGAPGQFRPVDVAIAGNRLYVVDIQHHTVHALDKRSGETLFKFGKAGSEVGSLYHPTNIAVAPNGDLFVVDTSNFRVQRFSAQGAPLGAFGQAGQLPGNFARPKGIAIDRTGRIYVGDSAFQNVQIFDADGKLLMHFGEPSEGVEGLALPTAVVIDYENVGVFARHAAPGFRIEYLVVVSSQYTPSKVDVFGFGRMQGVAYPEDSGKK